MEWGGERRGAGVGGGWGGGGGKMDGVVSLMERVV